MKGIIILGCEGRQDNGFVFCKGAENIILNLEKNTAKDNYILLLEYLEKTVKIYESPCCKMNVIMNAIYKFYEFGYLTDNQYKYITNFTQMHKVCGLILKVVKVVKE